MLVRFFIYAIRNLKRQKQTTLISITGLVVALLLVLLISQWCIYEFGYDKFNAKASRIYRLTLEESRPSEGYYRYSAYSSQPWISKIPDFYPEIESYVQLRPMLFTTIRNSETVFRTERAFKSDTSIFNLFSFSFIEGSPQNAMRAENEVILSESMAQKIFNGQDALNKVFEINTGNNIGFGKYTVTGIYKDFPSDSHFHPEILVYSNKRPVARNEVEYIYILLKEGNTFAQIRAREDQFYKEHLPDDQKNNFQIHYTLLTDIHLRSHLANEIENNGDIKQLKLFISIGIGIFLIALINYINLILVSFEQRSRYFHVNGIFGAKQHHNLLLLFFESLFIVFLVFIITSLIFKPLTQLLVSTGTIKTISLGLNPGIVIVSLMFLFFVLLAGIFPVFIIRIRPFRYLNQDISGLLRRKSIYVNNTLLVLQFAVSIVVIICSLMLDRQNNYMFSKNMGQENPDIVFLTREFPAEGSQINLLKEQLLKTPAVEDVSMCMLRPGDLVKGHDYVEYADIPEEFKNQSITILPVDDNFFSFFKIPFIAGGEKKYAEGPEMGNYILNEGAIRKLGFESPEKAVGTTFKIRDIGNEIITGGTITGVVENFNFASLYNQIEPTVFFQKPAFQCQFFIKLSRGMTDNSLEQIRKVWTNIFPDYPFNYEFLEDKYNNQYRKELITGRLIKFFSFICLILSVIGVWGISSSMVIRKTKEIGIRKVNGAKVGGILLMLNVNFLRWCIVAFFIATPVAWYIVGKWFENYVYKTNISWWIFILAGLIVGLIVLITVTIQSWRTATRNPVEALRYE
jgi:putative ABC transport system permease protein